MDGGIVDSAAKQSAPVGDESGELLRQNSDRRHGAKSGDKIAAASDLALLAGFLPAPRCRSFGFLLIGQELRFLVCETIF